MPEIPEGVYDPVDVPAEKAEGFGEGMRGIPEPQESLPSLQATTAALKEVVETMLGLRGDGSSALWDYIMGLWEQHNRVAPPYYNNPHGQYWHKIRDPAWAHLHFESFSNPESVFEGAPMANWDEDVVSPYQMETDLTLGTITIDEAGYGLYALSVSGFAGGQSNTNYVMSVYRNTLPTGIRMPLIFSGTMDMTSIGWTGVVLIPFDSTLQLRLEDTDPGGRTLEVYSMNWSMHRISPIAGTVGPAVTGVGFPSAGEIPPDWDK